MTRWGVAVLLVVAGCREAPREPDSAGARLEQAAVAAGLVADPTVATLAGSWSRDSDRVCVVGPASKVQRIGVVVDYGEGQGCSASGTVRQSGERLAIELGACRFEARFDGDRIEFPAAVPPACEALCSGRASLATLAVERVSGAASEATTLRGRGGAVLCAE